MSRSRASRRAAKRRRYVKRGERVKPSALAEAKKRPWPMATFLAKGLITPEQFEAGVEIVAGYDALTLLLGYRPTSIADHRALRSYCDEITPVQARWTALYIGFANELIRRFKLRARDVVELVRDDRRILPRHMPALIQALDLWHGHRDDWEPKRLTLQRARALHSSVTIPYRPAPGGIPSPKPQHADPTTASPSARSTALARRQI